MQISKMTPDAVTTYSSDGGTYSVTEQRGNFVLSGAPVPMLIEDVAALAVFLGEVARTVADGGTQ